LLLVLLALSCLEDKKSQKRKISWSKTIAVIVDLYFSFQHTLLKLSAGTATGYIFHYVSYIFPDGWVWISRLRANLMSDVFLIIMKGSCKKPN
jgi:hypothetical protein